MSWGVKFITRDTVPSISTCQIQCHSPRSSSLLPSPLKKVRLLRVLVAKSPSSGKARLSWKCRVRDISRDILPFFEIPVTDVTIYDVDNRYSRSRSLSTSGGESRWKRARRKKKKERKIVIPDLAWSSLLTITPPLCVQSDYYVTMTMMRLRGTARVNLFPFAG